MKSQPSWCRLSGGEHRRADIAMPLKQAARIFPTEHEGPRFDARNVTTCRDRQRVPTQ
jgi:hypothetical protein